MIFGRWLLGSCCLWLLLDAGSAHAVCPPGPGSSVTVSYHEVGGGAGTVQVLDGQTPEDSDNTLRGIRAAFEFGVAQNPPSPWRATGVVKAFSNSNGHAETRLTDLLIENVGGIPVSDVTLKVEHCFDNQITIPMPFRALVDGALLNTFDGIIREVHFLDYTAQVNAEFLSGGFSEAVLGVPGPVPFIHQLGPTSVEMVPPRASQTHTFFFYLDSLGDAIALEDSALILPASAGLPALSTPWLVVASALLALAGFGTLAFRARVRSAR